jgi:hypothetical protein
MKIKTIITLLLFIGTEIVVGQKQTGSWDKWQFLMGEWAGKGNGQPGQGSGTFSFTTDLEGNILVRKSHTEYPAVNNKPAFHHDDLLIVYKDNTGNPSKAIYFDNESHTINYDVTYVDNSIVLTSKVIQNAPRFRLIYNQLDNKKLNVKFEMTSPQNPDDFKTYLEGQATRK